MSNATDWLVSHTWVTYFIIYVFMAYVYTKVFKVRRLPILKEIIVYLLIGLSAFVLLFFQIDLRLPIVYSLAVAILMMLIVRIRKMIEGRK